MIYLKNYILDFGFDFDLAGFVFNLPGMFLKLTKLFYAHS